jgi:hypothetical protein
LIKEWFDRKVTDGADFVTDFQTGRSGSSIIGNRFHRFPTTGGTLAVRISDDTGYGFWVRRGNTFDLAIEFVVYVLGVVAQN